MDLAQIHNKVLGVVAIDANDADFPEGVGGIVFVTGRAEWDGSHLTVIDGPRRYRLPDEVLQKIQPGPGPLQHFGVPADYVVLLDELPEPDFQPECDTEPDQTPRFAPQWLNMAMEVTNELGPRLSIPRMDRLREAFAGIPDAMATELLAYCDSITSAACQLAEEVRADRLGMPAATAELSRRFPGLDVLTLMKTMEMAMFSTR